MNKIKHIYAFIIILCALLFSCNNNEIKNKISFSELKNMMLLPDSILTPEQKKIKLELGDIMYNYLIVKDKKFVFTLSRDEIIEKGSPEEFYDELIKELSDINRSEMDYTEPYLRGREEYKEQRKKFLQK